MLPYLDRVLKFGVLVVKHTETQWFFWNNFHKHQVTALQKRGRKKLKTPFTEGETFWDVSRFEHD